MTRIQADFLQAESVHRLDMATSGVLLVAMTKSAKREPRKIYIARVYGHPACDEGDIDLPLICDWPNRPLASVAGTYAVPGSSHPGRRVLRHA